MSKPIRNAGVIAIVFLLVTGMRSQERINLIEDVKGLVAPVVEEVEKYLPEDRVVVEEPQLQAKADGRVEETEPEPVEEAAKDADPPKLAATAGGRVENEPTPVPEERADIIADPGEEEAAIEVAKAQAAERNANVKIQTEAGIVTVEPSGTVIEPGGKRTVELDPQEASDEKAYELTRAQIERSCTFDGQLHEECVRTLSTYKGVTIGDIPAFVLPATEEKSFIDNTLDLARTTAEIVKPTPVPESFIDRASNLFTGANTSPAPEPPSKAERAAAELQARKDALLACNQKVIELSNKAAAGDWQAAAELKTMGGCQ